MGKGDYMYYIDDYKEYVNRYYWVWVGQNATIGQPNPITGKMSMYGNFICFSTKQMRDDYYTNWRSDNPSEFIKKCTPATGRKYKLGSSVFNYYQDLTFIVNYERDCYV